LNRIVTFLNNFEKKQTQNRYVYCFMLLENGEKLQIYGINTLKHKGKVMIIPLSPLG